MVGAQRQSRPATQSESPPLVQLLRARTDSGTLHHRWKRRRAQNPGDQYSTINGEAAYLWGQEALATHGNDRPDAAYSARYHTRPARVDRPVEWFWRKPQSFPLYGRHNDLSTHPIPSTIVKTRKPSWW